MASGAKANDLGASSDADLMLLVRTRDYPAFIRLFDRWRARAVSFAARMTGDPDLAEEIAHEAFTQLVSRAARYDSGREFETWFFSILHEITAAKVARRDPARGAELDRLAVLGQADAREQAEPGVPAASKPGPREAAARAFDALNRLKPVYREVVYLRAIERMGYDRIVEILGEKRATVVERMNYAVEHMLKDSRS